MLDRALRAPVTHCEECLRCDSHDTRDRCDHISSLPALFLYCEAAGVATSTPHRSFVDTTLRSNFILPDRDGVGRGFALDRSGRPQCTDVRPAVVGDGAIVHGGRTSGAAHRNIRLAYANTPREVRLEVPFASELAFDRLIFGAREQGAEHDDLANLSP